MVSAENNMSVYSGFNMSVIELDNEGSEGDSLFTRRPFMEHT